MEAYRVGILLVLRDDVTEGLRSLIRTLGTATDAADRLRNVLGETAELRFTGVSRSLTGLDRRLTGVSDAAARMGGKVDASFVGIDAAAARSVAGVKALRTELAEAGNLARGLRMPAAVGIMGGRASAVGMGGRASTGHDLTIAEILRARRGLDPRAVGVAQGRFFSDDEILAARGRVDLMRRGGAPPNFGNVERRAQARVDAAARSGGGGSGGLGGGLGGALLGRGGHGGEMGRDIGRYGGWGLMGAALYGTYEQAKLMREVNEILMGAGRSLNSKFRDTVTGVIRTVASETGVGYVEAGEAVKNTILGFPNIPFADRLKFAPSRARYAMIEHLMKPDISLQAAEKASIGLTHMAGNYSVADMKRMQADIAAISTLTPENLRRVETAASYAMPMARVAGIAPETVFATVAANQITGTSNTKSGTWLGGLITTGLNPKGGLGALLSSKAGWRRAVMMERLGLLQHGHLIGMRLLQEGRPDRLQQILAAHMAKIPKAELAGDFDIAAGGMQAGRQMAVLSQANFAQLAMLGIQKQHEFLHEGSAAALNQFTKYDPTLQLTKTMMDFTTALANLGTVALPPLTAVLKSLDATLKAIVPSLPGAKGAALTPGDLARSGAAVGGAAGFAVGGVAGAAVGSGVGGVGGYATGLNLAATKSQMQAGYMTMGDGLSGVMMVPFASTTVSQAATANGGWGQLGQWFSHLDKWLPDLGGAADKAQKPLGDLNGTLGKTPGAAAKAAGGLLQLNSAIQGLANIAILGAAKAKQAVPAAGPAPVGGKGAAGPHAELEHHTSAVVGALDRLAARLPARVTMDGRTVAALVGARLDREMRSPPTSRAQFDVAIALPSAGDSNIT